MLPSEELEAVNIELQQVEAEVEALLQQQHTLRERRDQLLRLIQVEERAPRKDWTREDFPWSVQVDALMKEVFGLASFRPLQLEVINATLQGRDVLCLMPSGGGKSLCYQLPALVGEGLTLVVSPLLSLIQDQVLALEHLKIPAQCLTTLTKKEEVNNIYKSMENGDLRLMYVTPEKIVASKRFMSKLEKIYQAGRLCRIAIDEAHCCSSWGNDFRPDYKKLGILKQQFPKSPLVALTATATHQVCEDLKAILSIEGCEFFRSSINRPNLHYEVRHKPAGAEAAVEEMVKWVNHHFPHWESGIVYCLSRKDCEVVSAELTSRGLPSRFYHADMDPLLRHQVHQQWSSGKFRIMVATVAFGMGINKADVRFVIHHTMSKSIENYYQESGRAGRDGLPARCILWYRFSDILRQAAVTCVEPGWQNNLMSILRYATSDHQCRRATIQQHFSEAPAKCDLTCDHCMHADKVAVQDVTRYGEVALYTLKKLQDGNKKVTLIQLIDAWRSARAEKEHQQLAKEMDKEGNERVIEQLLLKGLIQLEFGFTAYATNTYLAVSNSGRRIVDKMERESQKGTTTHISTDPLKLYTFARGPIHEGPVAQAGQAGQAGQGVRRRQFHRTCPAPDHGAAADVHPDEDVIVIDDGDDSLADQEGIRQNRGGGGGGPVQNVRGALIDDEDEDDEVVLVKRKRRKA